MYFYHKKAVRDKQLPRWYQIHNCEDTIQNISSPIKPKLFTEGPIKSPTMPYMAETSIVKALQDHPCDGHPDHSHSKMSYNK